MIVHIDPELQPMTTDELLQRQILATNFASFFSAASDDDNSSIEDALEAPASAAPAGRPSPHPSPRQT